MNRRIALLMGAAVGLAVIAPAAAQQKITYLLPAPSVLPAFAPWMLAQHLGYYKEAGYDVEFVTAKGGVDVAKQVGAGNAPIGGGLGDTPVIVRPNGVPVKAVAVLGGGSMMVVVGRKDKGIGRLQDLKGKTVTTLSYQDTTYYALLGSLAKVGLSKSDVNIIAVPAPSVPGFVIEGKADACACVPDWEVLVKNGVKDNAISFPSLDYFPSMAQAIVASDEMIAKNPKLVGGIVKATLKGVEFIMADPKKAAEVYVKAVPAHAGKEALMEATLRNFTERTYKGAGKLGMMDEARLDAVQKFYVSQKIVEKPTPLKDLYTNQFVQ